MAAATRKFTPSRAIRHTWLVLVGNDAKECHVECCVPDEDYIRRLLKLPADTPILVSAR